jgi:hypothetical protein
MDIALIQVDPNTHQVSLKLGHQSVKGMSKLVQIVVLSLLNTPGKDIFDPGAGGGIPEMIGMNYDPSDLSDILAELTRRVRKAEMEIVANQVGLSLDSEERLKSISIVSVGPGLALDEVAARIRVINELGQQSDVVL